MIAYSRPESAEPTARIERRQRDREAGQHQHEGAADQVREEGERQRFVGDDRHDCRDRQAAGERHERRSTEDPRGVL